MPYVSLSFIEAIQTLQTQNIINAELLRQNDVLT